MNKNSRSFKMLSKARLKSKDEDSASTLQPKHKPKITDINQQLQKSKPSILVLSDVTISPNSEPESLSIALRTLKQECIQAQKVLNVSEEDLKENIEPNLTCNADFVTELIRLDNTHNLDTFIDLDCLNNANITFEEANEQGTNVREDTILDSDWEKLENNNSTNLNNISEGTNVNEIDNTSFEINKHLKAMEKENSMLDEDRMESESNSDVVASDNENKKRKRKKRGFSDSRDWEYNTNKKKRQEGALYMGRKDNKFQVEKSERKLKVRCSCKEKRSKNAIKCYIINEEERQRVFQKFWRCTWEEKKIYIRGRAIASSIKRTRNRKSEGESRRKCSYSFFMDKNKERVRVCKTMFCNTLGVSIRTVTHWLNKSFSSPESKKTTDDDVETISKDLDKKQLKNDDKKTSVKEFFNNLPKLESHYCRKYTSKLYLEPCWKSKAELYSFYKDFCSSNKKTEQAGLTLFKFVFDELNLSLFSPKKDECDICVGYRTKNVSEEIYREHRTKKDEARNEKEKDKELQNQVFTMDLQSVLLCPQSTVSALYYKTKLILHNFTLFDLHTKDGYCFFWHEGEGELKSSCFSSIICTFLTTKVLPNMDPNNKLIILYSDGCSAQNRNSTLSNALLNFSIEHNVCIIQKYLEKGHTQMECDSMHSTIERKVSGRVINVPADYVYLAKTARKNPRPYEVQYLDHTYFKNFSKINFVNSIRPGRKAGDPTVQNIRALKYNPEGSIEYKIRHSHEFQILPVRFNKKSSMVPMESIPRLYHGKLKIKREKFEHLQSLKSTMEADYHPFYDSLEHD